MLRGCQAALALRGRQLAGLPAHPAPAIARAGQQQCGSVASRRAAGSGTDSWGSLLQADTLRRLLQLRCDYSPPNGTRIGSLVERARRELERQMQLPGTREAVRAAEAGDGEAGGSAQLCLLLEQFVDAVGGAALRCACGTQNCRAL